MKLLSRTPGPYSNESPAGYLLRLAAANGYVGTSVLVEIMEERAGHVLTPGWDYGKLQSLLGPRQILPSDFGYRPVGSYVRGAVSLMGHSLYSRHLGITKARICTQCIEEIGYMPAVWDLKAYVACPIHGCMMLKRCGSCGVRILTNRPAPLQCRCGADLRHTKVEPAPRSLIALMEVLHAKVMGQGECLVTAYSAGLPIDALLACELDILCKIIVMGATLFSWMQNSIRAPRKTTEIVKYLPQVGELFSCWPHNFYKFCGDWHQHCVQRGGCSTEFHVCFKWLFTLLYKNLRKRKRQTQFMLEAGLAYGYRRWDLRPIRIRAPALRSIKMPPRRYGSNSDAARILGMPTYTVIRWLGRGLLPARSLGGKKIRRWIVDLYALAALKISSSKAMEARTAARRAGIPHKVFSSLRRDGDIPATYMAEIRSALAIEDVDEFISSIVRVATPGTSKAGHYPLVHFLDANVPVARKVKLLRDIRDGVICVHRFGKSCIRNLYLQEDLLLALRLELREVDKTMNIRKAMLRHGLSYDEAMAIFSKLGARRGTGGRCAKRDIESERLDKFMREYVPLRLVAREERVSGSAMRKAAENHASDCLLILSSGRRPANRPNMTYGVFLKRRRLKKVRRLAQVLSRTA
jgi:TniQ